MSVPSCPDALIGGFLGTELPSAAGYLTVEKLDRLILGLAFEVHMFFIFDVASSF